MAVRSLGNVTVTYNAINITGYCNQADLNATLEEIEVTNLASTGKETLTGQTEWTIALAGYWHATLDGALAPSVVTPGTKRTAIIAYTDEASTTVTYTWTSNAEIGDYAITASATGGALGWSGTLRLSGAPNRA